MEEREEVVVGILTLIFYALIIALPYYTSYKKGKVGWKRKGNDKYFLYSTALQWTDHRTLEMVLAMFFFVSCSSLYYLKGYFEFSDIRLIPPILTVFIVVCIYLLIQVEPKRYALHSAIAGMLFLVAVVIPVVVTSLYTEYYTNVYKMDIVQNVILVIAVLTIMIGTFNVYNTYLRKQGLWPRYVPWVKNALGVSQFLLIIGLGVFIGYVAFMPPLPPY